MFFTFVDCFVAGDALGGRLGHADVPMGLLFAEGSKLIPLCQASRTSTSSSALSSGIWHFALQTACLAKWLGREAHAQQKARRSADAMPSLIQHKMYIHAHVRHAFTEQ